MTTISDDNRSLLDQNYLQLIALRQECSEAEKQLEILTQRITEIRQSIKIHRTTIDESAINSIDYDDIQQLHGDLEMLWRRIQVQESSCVNYDDSELLVDAMREEFRDWILLQTYTHDLVNQHDESVKQRTSLNLAKKFVLHLGELIEVQNVYIPILESLDLKTKLDQVTQLYRALFDDDSALSLTDLLFEPITLDNFISCLEKLREEFPDINIDTHKSKSITMSLVRYENERHALANKVSHDAQIQLDYAHQCMNDYAQWCQQSPLLADLVVSEEEILNPLKLYERLSLAKGSVPPDTD